MSSDIIAVVDCDSFFVSCEQNETPELWGKPVCVLSNNDGCVIARSKEAKKLGIRMGMPYFMAKKQFPSAVYLSGNHDLYSVKSKQIMQMLYEYSPEIEQYSIDEAFLNFKGLQKFYQKDYFEMAVFIRAEIKEKTGIPVSIGVSRTKTLAKLASKRAKNSDEGVYVISSSMISKELENTQVGDVWGFGKNITPLLLKHGVTNALEFINFSDSMLKRLLGKRGIEMKKELSGELVYPINMEYTLPKSIQHTSSFPEFTSDKTYIKNALNIHIHSTCKKLRRSAHDNSGMKCNAVMVMLRTKDFQVYTDKTTLSSPTNWEFDVGAAAAELFEKLYNPSMIYRSCGVVLFNLTTDSESQLSLFDAPINNEKAEKLANCLDNLENKFGRNIVTTGFYKATKRNRHCEEVHSTDDAIQ